MCIDKQAFGRMVMGLGEEAARAKFIALSPQDRCERLLIQYAKRLIAAYDAPVEKVEDWHKKASAAMSNLRASCREHDRIVARSTTLDKG